MVANGKSIAVSGGNLVQILIELHKMNIEQKTNNNTSPAIAVMQCYAQPYIQLFNCDNLQLMAKMGDESVDVILTDPPYKYLKHKLDRDFDEEVFFNECKRVLTKNGFIVMFGRGTSFYRWNTILADLDFQFKEEIVWNKSYSTSPLLPLSRIHETASIHSKGKGKIQKSKVPYLEMKKHNIDSIISDIKRMRSVFTQAKSMQAVLDFLENNFSKKIENYTSKNAVTTSKKMKNIDRCVSIMQSVEFGLNEKSIIRTDRKTNDKFTKFGVNTDKRKSGDRCVNVMQSIEFGLNEKSIIKQLRNHYNAIHPTEKPVRLLERLLALVIPQDKPKSDVVVLDPFGGSFSTMEAVYNMGMQGVSCEIDEEYYELGKERIEKLPPCQTSLFD